MHVDNHNQEDQAKHIAQAELQFESPRNQQARDQVIQAQVQEAIETYERMSGFLQKRRE